MQEFKFYEEMKRVRYLIKHFNSKKGRKAHFMTELDIQISIRERKFSFDIGDEDLISFDWRY